jgi:hypothetical protein
VVRFLVDAVSTRYDPGAQAVYSLTCDRSETYLPTIGTCSGAEVRRRMATRLRHRYAAGIEADRNDSLRRAGRSTATPELSTDASHLCNCFQIRRASQL